MESAALGTRPLRCPTISIGAELCANWRLPGLFFETASLSSLYVGEGRRRCRLLAQSVSYCGAAPCPELGGKPDSITVEPVLFARRRLRGWRAWCKALMRRRIRHLVHEHLPELFLVPGRTIARKQEHGPSQPPYQRRKVPPRPAQREARRLQTQSTGHFPGQEQNVF